jgi:hypothetical protein
VSRQTYAEAALLPFSLNTFTFESRAFQELFEEILTTRQTHAINAVHLRLIFSVDGLAFRRPGRYGHDIRTKVSKESLPHGRMLPGLREVTVSVAQNINRSNPGGRYFTKDDFPGYKEWLRECLRSRDTPELRVVIRDAYWWEYNSLGPGCL